MTRASANIYIDHVYFHHCLSKRKRGKMSSKLSFQIDYAPNFCKELRVGSSGGCCQGCVAAFTIVEFSSCARWAELRIFVNKSCKKTSTVSFFF